MEKIRNTVTRTFRGSGLGKRTEGNEGSNTLRETPTRNPCCEHSESMPSKDGANPIQNERAHTGKLWGRGVCKGHVGAG